MVCTRLPGACNQKVYLGACDEERTSRYCTAHIEERAPLNRANPMPRSERASPPCMRLPGTCIPSTRHVVCARTGRTLVYAAWGNACPCECGRPGESAPPRLCVCPRHCTPWSARCMHYMLHNLQSSASHAESVVMILENLLQFFMIRYSDYGMIQGNS